MIDTAESVRLQVLRRLRVHGVDVVSFLALESSLHYWFDGRTAPESRGEGGAEDPKIGTGGAEGGCVAYFDTGSAWVAAGGPIADREARSHVAQRFTEVARTAGRRSAFFAVDGDGNELDGFSRLLLGEQPFWKPSDWPASLTRHRRLREQIRRARAKGVVVREVSAADLAPSRPLRHETEALLAEWLRSRRMLAMKFLVALEPFHFPDEHRYFVAERKGRVVAFLSAVPIYARRGWFIEDVLRSGGAPNGTTETLIDAFMRSVPEADVATMGLAPLTGAVANALRLARLSARPLYDFAGIRAFKERLRPTEWRPVYLFFPTNEFALTAVIDSLRAFADGSLLSFALRSLTQRPSVFCGALVLPLIPWTLVLAGLAASGHAALLGFSWQALAGWVVFDVLLIAQLLLTAWRPRARPLAFSALAASIDALLSIGHLAGTGWGESALQVAFRGIATFAPSGAAIILGSATLYVIRRGRLDARLRARARERDRDRESGASEPAGPAPTS